MLKLKTLLIFLMLFLTSASVVNASDFFIDQDLEYTFKENGQADVVVEIEIENALSISYAESYQLNLNQIDISELSAFENGEKLKTEFNRTGNGIVADIEFDKSVVGKSKKRNVRIEYVATNLASKTGEVWEISIPSVNTTENFRSASVKVNIPKNMGTVAYIDPENYKLVESLKYKSYLFNNIDADKGLTLAFGQFQVYSYVLKYHLENTRPISTQSIIALPPDSAFQKIFLEDISPQPSKIIQDDDGNWLAYFDLDAEKRIDVEVAGRAQLYSVPRNDYTYPNTDINKYLDKSKYWQVDNDEIKELAEKYKTPKEIYDFVVDYLSYDYGRVTPEVKRLGSVGALENPNSAICMEFTDLFIAIARTAGIPAREINGYAYTQNPRIQPLSLVADVLHSWPEYYDKYEKIWKPVDPTWGNTSNLDYFNKNDLRHLTFVVHGLDSEEPLAPGSYKLGDNPQKDVYVNFSELPESRNPKISILMDINRSIPFIRQKYRILVKNDGPVAVYNKEVEINSEYESDSFVVERLLPKSEYVYTYTVTPGLLGQKIPDDIQVNGINTQKVFKTNKSSVIIYSLLVILFIITLFIILIIYKYKRTNILTSITSKFKK